MENISFADFQKLDLRVAEIKTAEDIEGADKLYKLVVDLGEEERTLVAGIKQFYSKEELPGKKIVVLANLEPKTLRGVESRGMLLAAHVADRSNLALLTVERDVSSGSGIS